MSECIDCGRPLKAGEDCPVCRPTCQCGGERVQYIEFDHLRCRDCGRIWPLVVPEPISA